MRLVLVFLFLSWSTTNGFTVREASEVGGSIDETINRFTSVEPDFNKTESTNVSDKIPVEVTVDKETEKAEKEEENIEIKPLPTIVEETVKPSVSPSSITTPTTSTSTTTTTPKPLDSSGVTTTTAKPMVILKNDTDSIAAVSFSTNDTMGNEFFSSLDSILVELDGKNETSNTLDTSSGGISSSNDEFSNSSEIVSTRIRAISTSEGLLEIGDTGDDYKPPIEPLRYDDEDESKMSNNLTRATLEDVTKLSIITEPSIDDGKMEIVVDEPRTVESEKHWSKFSKATGYKIIWSLDKNQSERKANFGELGEEGKKRENVDQHDRHGMNGEKVKKNSCDTLEKSGYFVGEIDDLSVIEAIVNGGDKRIIKTVRCGLLGLSKILENQDDEIGDWTNESILPLKEINRLERQIEDQASTKCNCSAPLIGDVLHSIYIDPFLHEKRHQLYKNHEWSSIIGDLRSTHVKIKHLYFQLHRHHILIENLFNISATMSSKAYQWRAKQMDIVINNANRRVRGNPYRHYNRG